MELTHSSSLPHSFLSYYAWKTRAGEQRELGRCVLPGYEVETSSPEVQEVTNVPRSWVAVTDSWTLLRHGFSTVATEKQGVYFSIS